MNLKIFFPLFVFFLISCDVSVENKNLKNLKKPCDFIDVKLEIFKQINVLYDKYLDVDNYKEVEMVDFSKLMKLWQKNDEIDFQIGLNHWEESIKNCTNYQKVDSLKKKMNI